MAKNEKYYKIFFNKIPINRCKGNNMKCLKHIFISVFILTLSFLFMWYLKYENFKNVFDILYEYLTFLLVSVSSSILFKKSKFSRFDNFTDLIKNNLLSAFFMTTTTTLLMFIFKEIGYSRVLFFGILSIYIIIESSAYFIFYYTYKFKRDNPSFSKTTLISELRENLVPITKKVIQKLPLQADFAENSDFGDEVINQYFDSDPDIFKFLHNSLKLKTFNREKCFSVDFNNKKNIETYGDESVEILFNKQKINNFRRINKMLKLINQKLKPGGVYIGKAQTNIQRKLEIKKKYGFLSSFIYSWDFIFNRVFPKLTLFKSIYFFFTRGKNRPLSRCEILGRLYFCGFEVVNIRTIKNELYFCMIKTREPLADQNPSYGPVFKMKRTGLNGKRIFVYKLRTMHPYAEYLQNFMVQFHGYGDNGKIQDDFRVTSWGKKARRLWLDELPQLLNLVKGDLAIFGVRPLSDSFLKEYPEDLKLARQKFKPGCVPPYVALKMQNVEDYIQSEVIYINERKKHPLTANIRFFWLAVYNILTNKIRSQ